MTAKVIEGLTHEEYEKLPGEHAGALRQILTSPLAYKRYLERPDEDRDVLRLGRAIHTAVLQPARFKRDYVCWSGGVRRGKEWDAYVAAAERKHQTILKEDQLDLAVQISKSVRAHPVASKILAEKARAELTITWVDAQTGIQCKARLDLLGDSTLSDLKTCRDPAPARFATAAASLGYHFQLAMYADAVAAAGLGTPDVRIIAAQNCEPFDTVVYALDEELLLIGHDQYARALALLVECSKSDKWPGQAVDDVVPLKLPAWAGPSAELDVEFGTKPIGNIGG